MGGGKGGGGKEEEKGEFQQNNNKGRNDSIHFRVTVCQKLTIYHPSLMREQIFTMIN